MAVIKDENVVSSEAYEMKGDNFAAEIERVIQILRESDPKKVAGLIFAVVEREGEKDDKENTHALVKQALIGPAWITKRLIAQSAELYQRQFEEENNEKPTKHLH
jgi:hypothetical protein